MTADTWLIEARTIGFAGDELKAAEAELTAARDKVSTVGGGSGGLTAGDVVGASSLQRLEYVAPKFPAVTRNRATSGWVELEFTVRADGSTGRHRRHQLEPAQHFRQFRARRRSASGATSR